MSVDSALGQLLEEFLPKQREGPFVTLTYACSLDSRISLGPGIRTTISHEQTKDMTQYLRYHHDAIVIGAGTACADDPGLNCKYPGSKGAEHSPRPFIIDPSGRWQVTEDSKIVRLARQGQGKAPYVITSTKGRDKMESDHARLIEALGGRIIVNDECFGQLNWAEIVKTIGETGAKSIMIEGGGHVINTVLEQGCFDSLVVTIGPVYLGAKGVEVSPAKAVNLSTPKWWTGIQDAVLCAKRTKTNN
uniref:2,5-diamino-6-ribosylamino-4(3H)-pyrimidinone 5'-phosphate reductase n=1 Tax=Blastobotrys adeninivorans TaxID=409370 RepID=A0A060T111_BLAAD